MALIMGKNLALYTKQLYIKPGFKRQKSIISNNSVFHCSPAEKFILPNHYPQPEDEGTG